MQQELYSNKEFKQLLSTLEDLIDQSEKLPYPKARELSTAILQHFDLVHREPLMRMCKYLQKHAPDHYLKIQGDYTVNVLLKLYDIIEDNEDEHQSVVGFVPEDNIGILTPIIKWEALCLFKEVEDGTLYKDTIRGNQIIYSRINNEIFAIKNECLDSALPLDTGEFKGDHIICPWHGCRYDLKTGRMIDNQKVKQETFETRINDTGFIEIKVPVKK